MQQLGRSDCDSKDKRLGERLVENPELALDVTIHISQERKLPRLE